MAKNQDNEGLVGLAVRVPPKLRNQVRVVAQLTGVTVQALVVEALEEHLGNIDTQALFDRMQEDFADE